MGIADAFGREDRFEIKTESFIRMAQEAAAAEANLHIVVNAVNCESFIRMAQEAAAAEANLHIVVNAVNCNVPYRYIREMLSGISEEPKVIVEENESDEDEDEKIQK